VDETTTIGGSRIRRGSDPRRVTSGKHMPTPELISLIVALLVWIVLLGTLPTDS